MPSDDRISAAMVLLRRLEESRGTAALQRARHRLADCLFHSKTGPACEPLLSELIAFLQDHVDGKCLDGGCRLLAMLMQSRRSTLVDNFFP